jgi:chromosome segregation ATPase
LENRLRALGIPYFLFQRMIEGRRRFAVHLEVLSMLPRHKKARSDMKSAEKKLRDAQAKYRKMKEELGKAQKGVADAKARLAAAQELWES